MKRLFCITAVAACAALAVAGCATPRQQPGGPRAATEKGRLMAATPAASATSPRPASHKQRAFADARHILASFVPPPGARRLRRAPGAGEGMLRQPFQTPGVFHLIDKASFWKVPGQPQQLLNWEGAHLPRQFRTAGTSTESDHGTTILWGQEYSLPAVPTVLLERDLLIAAVRAGHGKTYIRVDAQVTWVPAKPAAELVPKAAQVVTVRLQAGYGAGLTQRAGTATVTDPARVRRIAALVDALPLAGWETISCPMYSGGAVTLTFRARAGGPALVKVSADLIGCPPASFTAHGGQLPLLTTTTSFVRQVAKVAGLRPPGKGSAPGGVAQVSP
jgi:hypothetical protein